MLPDRALELLTAYVDGELTNRQREEAMRLTQQSAEARQVLNELQDHARQLRQLPPRKLEPTFAAALVQKLRRSETTSRRRFGLRPTHYAIAASLLAILAGGLSWLLNRPGRAVDPAPNIAVNKPTPESPPKAVDPLVAQVVEGVFSEFARPLPPERPGTKLAFEDLAKTQWHEHLVGGMAKQQSVHLDVAVTNQRQAVHRLETVLENKGIKVVVDALARGKLGDQKVRTDFVIYAENIRADELAAMLYELGTDERARTSIEALTVSNVTDDDQKSLSNLLGIGREELQTPPAKALPLQTFIPKQDKQPEPAERDPARAASSGEPRLAMVMANEARGGTLSSEIQYFLAQRRQLQPGALRVIVVVHQA
jgi:hypothetical protein